MPRKPRPMIDNGYYHVISRGNNQESIFLTADYYRSFKRSIHEAKVKFSWKLFHYCLMPNHFHLLVHIEKGHDLPKIMHSMLLNYSRWYKHQTGHIGYLWQGRFKSPVIDQDSYMLECGRYIERNPVRANIVKSPEQYPWSSYAHYAKSINDPLVDTDPYFDSFGFTLKEKQKNYRNFVRTQGPYDTLLDKTLETNNYF